MRKIFETIFVLLFFLTGCGIDSIFNGCAVEWFVAFGLLILIAWGLWGGKR